MSLSVARPIVAEPATFSCAPVRVEQGLEHLRRQVGHLGRLGQVGRHLRPRRLRRRSFRGRLEVGRRGRRAGRVHVRPDAGVVGIPVLRAGMRSRRRRPCPLRRASALWWPGPSGWLSRRPLGVGLGARLDDAHRIRLGRTAGHTRVPPHFEGQQRSFGIADVDALAVVEVDHRDPPAIGEGPVQRAVVDREPPALIEAQQQVGARYQWMGDAHVGAQVASDRSSWPAANVRSVPSCRTVSAGGAGAVIGSTLARGPAETLSPLGEPDRVDRRTGNASEPTHSLCTLPVIDRIAAGPARRCDVGTVQVPIFGFGGSPGLLEHDHHAVLGLLQRRRR